MREAIGGAMGGATTRGMGKDLKELGGGITSEGGQGMGEGRGTMREAIGGAMGGVTIMGMARI